MSPDIFPDSPPFSGFFKNRDFQTPENGRVGPDQAPEGPFLTENREYLEYGAFSQTQQYTTEKNIKLRIFYVPEHFS